MTAVLLTVGDELLLGQVVNSNAAWLGETLAGAGVDLRRMETVGDGVEEIQAALARAFDEAGLVVVTGGLGPTHDDLTREAVAGFFGVPLREDAELLGTLRARYESRGRAFPEIGRAMACVPDGFEVLPNPMGTAPSLWGRREDGRVVVLLPGVPYEMKAIVTERLLPRLEAARDGVVLTHTFLTAGKGESQLSERIGDPGQRLGQGVGLAFLPSLGTCRLRLTVRGADRDEAARRLTTAADALRGVLGTDLVAEADTTLEAAVGELLAQEGLCIATAESCTGGAISARLTSTPGASRYVSGGIVAYGNGVKTAALSVGADALERHGAVSEAVALQMAHGVRRALGADVGVSATGIAGPGGGTPEKPVGTVWVAYVDAETERAVRLSLTPHRALNIGLTTTAALDLVRRQVLRRRR